MDENEQLIIHSQAVYGVRIKQPLVQITINKEIIMMPVDNAKQFAYDILDVAHAAVTDAFLVDWAKETLELPEQHVPTLLNEFRQWRIKRDQNGTKTAE